MKGQKTVNSMIATRSRESDLKIKRGFTIVELVIVMTLVGIVSAIALPTFIKQTDKARATEAITKISGLLTSAHSEYQLDQDSLAVLEALGDATSGQLGLATTGGDFEYNAEVDGDQITISAEGKSSTDGGDPRIEGKLIYGCIALETGKVDISRNLLEPDDTSDVNCD